jgi:hypothetical protein
MPNGSYEEARVSMGVPPPFDGWGIYVLDYACLSLFELGGVPAPYDGRSTGALSLFKLDCACLCLIVLVYA